VEKCTDALVFLSLGLIVSLIKVLHSNKLKGSVRHHTVCGELRLQRGESYVHMLQNALYTIFLFRRNFHGIFMTQGIYTAIEISFTDVCLDSITKYFDPQGFKTWSSIQSETQCLYMNTVTESSI